MNSYWKKTAAGVITALVVAVLVISAGLRSSRRMADATPEQCLDRMFEATKRGDVASYLDCFTGDLRGQLEAAAAKDGAPAFCEYLKQVAAPIKGRAILHHKTEFSGPAEVRLVVDRVYEGRPWEFQTYRLQRESGQWRIAAVEPPQPHEPPVPYGTPVVTAPTDTGPRARPTNASE